MRGSKVLWMDRRVWMCLRAFACVCMRMYLNVFKGICLWLYEGIFECARSGRWLEKSFVSHFLNVTCWVTDCKIACYYTHPCTAQDAWWYQLVVIVSDLSFLLVIVISHFCWLLWSLISVGYCDLSFLLVNVISHFCWLMWSLISVIVIFHFC